MEKSKSKTFLWKEWYTSPYVETMNHHFENIKFPSAFCPIMIIDTTYPNTGKVVLN